MDDFDLAGIIEPARGIAAWPEPARRALMIGGGCTLVVLMELGLIWLSINVTLNARVPEGMVVRADVARRGVVGAKTPLRITVRNESDRPFTLHSVSVRSETRRRFKVEIASPAPPHGATSLFGAETWKYEQAVAPDKSWSVTLQVTPLRPGKHRGILELQAGSGLVPTPFTIEARAASPAPTTAVPPHPANPSGR